MVTQPECLKIVSIYFKIKGLDFYLWPVWYMYLKTENCYLKTFVEIRVGEKVH